MLGSVVQIHLSPPGQLKCSPASRGFFSPALRSSASAAVAPGFRFNWNSTTLTIYSGSATYIYEGFPVSAYATFEAVNQASSPARSSLPVLTQGCGVQKNNSSQGWSYLLWCGVAVKLGLVCEELFQHPQRKANCQDCRTDCCYICDDRHFLLLLLRIRLHTIFSVAFES
jgi:hypothetical protein